MNNVRISQISPQRWHHKKPEKSNQFCLYCGAYVGGGSITASNEEHLIGRRFVPKGTMENSFNFSFRCCVSCNGRKADIERHVSSFTLLSSPSLETNEIARLSAESKAYDDYHPETKVTMGDAIEQQSLEFEYGGATIKLGFTCRTPAASNYIPELAIYHIQGLFSLITSNGLPPDHNIQLISKDEIQVHKIYPHTDWGNPELVEIIRRAALLPVCTSLHTGQGHFRACLRQSENGGWFWALEWNKSLRVVGSIYTVEEVTSLFMDLPELRWNALPDGSGKMRQEQPSPDLGELLFP